MKIRVLACQQPLHEPLSAERIGEIVQLSPDFVCLPEHYPLPAEVQTISEAAQLFQQRKKYLHTLSNELNTVLVGGTLTEKDQDGYYNTCYVFDRGVELGYYRKVNPTEREQEAGVLCGDEFKVFDIRGVRIGVLICADVLNLRSFSELATLGCQISFIPTASPYRDGESVESKFERDQSIFVEGARKLQCPVVKTCGVGTTFGHRIQGRSLIATPEKIITRVSPEGESHPALLFAELDV